MIAAAASLVAPATGLGSTLARAAAPGKIHKVAFGAAEITVISDGHLTFGLGFALPKSPPAEVEALLRSAALPEDGIRAEINVTAIRVGRDVVLVDAGSGANFMPTAGELPARLEAAGIDPDAVTHVVFTHAHPDHLWGAIDEFNEPRFPNATFHISAAEWDYWTDPNTVTRVPASFQGMAAGSARMLRLLEPKIKRLEAGDAIVPGLTVLRTAGHTPGHVSPVLETPAERLLVGGDILGHSIFSFERPDWVWGADADAAVGAETRRRILDMLAVDRMQLLGYHLPWPGIGRVERKGSAFRFSAS